MVALTRQRILLLGVFQLICGTWLSNAFVPSSNRLSERHASRRRISNVPKFAYVPQVEDDGPTKTKKKSLHPKVGDIIRYYDLDGGEADGEIMVGKISFIQKDLGQENSWIVDISELEDVGDGYYADYPSRKRGSKKALRNLKDVSPVFASFVRSESAFKVPRSAESGEIQVRAKTYDLDDYLGPFSGENAIDQEVVKRDEEIYDALKGKLLKYAAITGVAGTLVVDLVKGAEDAIIYAGGALASIAYLFFLQLKTDTIASPNAKFGSNISNLRFVMPVLVILCVALYNQSLGDANPVQSDNPFDTVTTEQFSVAIIGFLTYRIPLFFSQIQESFKDEAGDVTLPGSAGVAMQLAKGSESTASDTSSFDAASVPLLVVSGPQATGRSQLVQRLIAEGDGRFVEPKRIDRVQDGATFDRLLQRDEFLEVDSSERYGLTKNGILNAVEAEEAESVVVIDADVSLVKKLKGVAGTRIIGVWVGLGSVNDFESRLEKLIESGQLAIPDDETKESVIRARTREIVQEIEYGITSGVFEFTILNDDEEKSLRELRNAASYCFK